MHFSTTSNTIIVLYDPGIGHLVDMNQQMGLLNQNVCVNGVNTYSRTRKHTERNHFQGKKDFNEKKLWSFYNFIAYDCININIDGHQ